MIQITIYQDSQSRFCGFDCLGHAVYADPGQDIVCAAVSVLTITAMNAIEELTDASFTQEADEEAGSMTYRLKTFEHDSQLLFRSMVLGLEEMESNYSEYIDLIFREVQET